jgi:hypothetical protein
MESILYMTFRVYVTQKEIAVLRVIYVMPIYRNCMGGYVTLTTYMCERIECRTEGKGTFIMQCSTRTKMSVREREKGVAKSHNKVMQIAVKILSCPI